MTRILYVEDNEDNVYMLRRRLERKGLEVVVANDGKAGIAAAECERPDLILMDLSLPGIDGWEAARRLKSSPDTQAIPIIALSAHAMTGDRERALDYASVGSVSKLASRLCDAAEAGQILLPQRLVTQVDGFVHVAPVGTRALKGFQHPIAVYNVVGLKDE